MPTLAEIIAAKKAAAATPQPMAPMTPMAEWPRQLGFAEPGEHLPMVHPTEPADAQWEEARLCVGHSLGVIIQDGRGWLAVFRPGSDPIFLFGPLPSIIAPF